MLFSHLFGAEIDIDAQADVYLRIASELSEQVRSIFQLFQEDNGPLLVEIGELKGVVMANSLQEANLDRGLV